MKKLALVLLGLLLTAGGLATVSAQQTGNTQTNQGATELAVFFAPTSPDQPYYQDIQNYLLKNEFVSGGGVAVQWSDIDSGNGVYDFTIPDAAAKMWTDTGKKIYLYVMAVGEFAPNTVTPQYVWSKLGPKNYTTCNSQQLPNYLSPAFQGPYKNFIRAVVEHYASNPAVGYIRIGLGKGDETNPGDGLTGSVCASALNTWGLTAQSWQDYLVSMLQFEASLNSPHPLRVGLVKTNFFPQADVETIAAQAVALRIGIGSQGLQKSDVNNCASSTSDWCELFNEYTGKVPLELQTLAQSDPTNQSQTGSLTVLIPFAIANHADILEIYLQDWLLAYAPDYPGYVQYGAGYRAVIEAAVDNSRK